MKVYVKRQPSGYDGALIDLNDVDVVGWGTVTGGTQTVTTRSYLMGKITIETLDNADGYISCSHRHNYDSGIKVCIIKNQTPRDTWKYLIEVYGLSPGATAPKKTYCTTKILELLQTHGEMTRGALRQSLLAEDYLPSTIRYAFKRMSKDGRIKLYGSNFSINQMVCLYVRN